MLGVAAGAGFWLLAQGLEGFLADGSLAVAVVKELLELAGAATLALALLGVYKARFAGSGVEGGGWGALQELVLSLEPRRVAVVVGAGILVLAAAGAVVGAGVQAHVLDLNAEQTLPALFSGALLVAAGGLALMLWRVAPPGGPHREWWRALAVVFTLLGIDEVAALHEEVQDATGIHPGQLVLLPLVAVAGAAWIATLRYLTGQAAARWLWIGGAGAWALSQAIDATQPRERFVWSVVPEESLEMAGSALFAIALLLLLRSLLVGAAAPGDAGLPGARAPAGAAA